MRILLVDDEKELVSTMVERLSFRGIEADWVTSGEDALKQAENKNYDLALIDVKMPGISGIKLMEMLNQKYPDMKFIFMTGHGSEQDYKVGSAHAPYLVKPIEIETLVDKIHEVLEN
jgi:DNA-binding response OmpR family regulator